LPVIICFFFSWSVTYYILSRWTNSTVPLLDSFTNALSFIGLWALARKYIEQWLFWVVVDVVSCVLYVQKGIPFKACLYGLYVIIAVAGYYKWKTMLEVKSVS
jgi:nicotinamide mononucleotide transporter